MRLAPRQTTLPLNTLKSEIAATAAALVVEEGLEYGPAKRRALKQLGLSPESHLVVRDGQLLTENDALRNGEVVKLVAVISGG